MTDPDLEKLEALAKAASSGKWIADDNVVRSVRDYGTTASVGRFTLPSDAKFAATAHEAVPALIARVKELEAERKWVFDTLIELNVSNYNHDDVCNANAASVEVMMALQLPPKAS
jgi:hypothetical protein